MSTTSTDRIAQMKQVTVILDAETLEWLQDENVIMHLEPTDELSGMFIRDERDVTFNLDTMSIITEQDA